MQRDKNGTVTKYTYMALKSIHEASLCLLFLTQLSLKTGVLKWNPDFLGAVSAFENAGELEGQIVYLYKTL